MKQGTRKRTGAPGFTPLGAGTQRVATRRIARVERERRMQRVLYAVAGLLLALVVLVPIVAYVVNVMAPAGRAIAHVAGTPLLLEDYAKLLSFEAYALEVRQADQRQRNIVAMNNLREEVRKNPELAQSAQFSPESLAHMERQMEGSLLQERSELGATVLRKLVAAQFLRQEAERRGITLTAEDMTEARLRIFAPLRDESSAQDEDASRAEGTAATPTPPASPTPAPTPTPTREQRLDQATASEKAVLALLKTLSPEDFERLVIIPAAYQLKLDQVLRAEVPESAEQVHARHIVLDTEEDAKKARERLVAGEDFATVAKEVSKDTTSAEKGGDLGWQPRDAFVKEFADVVFSLPAGQLSEPIKTSFGYHIVEVLGREVRPLSEETRKGLQNSALDRLLRDLMAPERGLVTYTFTADDQVWARNYIRRQQSGGLLSFLRG